MDIHMKLGDSGEAYFLEECEDDEDSEEDTNSSLTDVQSLINYTKDDDMNNFENLPLNDGIEKNQICDIENLKYDNESYKSSDSITTLVNTSCQEKSGQKRIRRKKKNRASKHTIQTDTNKRDQLESSGDNDRECEEVPCNKERNYENEVSSLHYTENELHPFSDSEISNINHSQQKYKKRNSIEETYDCKSDSEYEIFKANTNDKPQQRHDNISWDWGELPNVQKDNNSNNSETQSKSRSSILGGMLGFIIKDKETNEDDKGIYLDDLDPNDMNPEVAAKYFPKFTNRSSLLHRRSIASDEDIESGNGPSLSNSPQSAEFNYQHPEFNDFDDKNITSIDITSISKLYHDMSMSLCGGIENFRISDSANSEHFLQSIISYDDFLENPFQILADPNLVIRMGGKYYTWKLASVKILSLLMFQRPLPEKTLEALKEQCIPKKKTSAQNSTSSWRSWFRSNPPESNLAIEEDNTIQLDNPENDIIDSANGATKIQSQ